MSNSPLVDYTKISPNKTSPRNHTIDTITIHCYVGQASVESMGNWFSEKGANASCNYGIGTDGRIALIVDEGDRSWCSSNRENDHRAITIECASDKTDPYAINDKVYKSLIELCADICKRNNIKELKWKADKSLIGRPDKQNLTVHRWFANKACVPTFSEVLTRKGWLPLSDVEIGDEIACADLDNLNITFEEVYDLVPVREQDTYTNNELTATKDHRMVYSCQQNKSSYRIEDFKHLLNSGNQIYIPLAGYSNFEGLPITDDVLRFLVAVQADGHYMYDVRKTDNVKSYYGLEFHVSKPRKIERLLEIVDSIGFDYKRTDQSNGSVKIRIYNQAGTNIVNDLCEKYLNEKCFTWEWLNLSPEQAKLFLDEILLWDGCKAANIYSSNQRINLDIVNAIAAINGIGSRLFANNVQFRESPYITLGENTKRHAKQHGTRYTKVTCVSVKTGIFLMRQEGKTFIIGNCPGDYIYSRLGQIAKEVNLKLGITEEVKDEPTIENVIISDSNVEEISKVVYGEAGVIQSYNALLGAAQCIHDMLESGQFGKTVTEVMKHNYSAYGTKNTTDDARKAVYDVFVNGKRRFSDAKVLQFRSFTKYSDGNGNMDKTKCADLLKKYTYLGKDARNNQWGHLYFGTKITGETPKEEPTTEVKEEFKPFQVKVNISYLNIRTGPGENYAKTGQVTGIGAFTIVEVKEGKGSNSGWGRLKSGAGWICLDYATPL